MAQTNANLIWKIAELLRGPYQPNQYGDVILPFTILRRLDCILEPTKNEVLAEYKKIAATKVDPGVLLKAKFKLLLQHLPLELHLSDRRPRGRGRQPGRLHRALLAERA
jgi:type I restriction-modification system DNA methylase subunit